MDKQRNLMLMLAIGVGVFFAIQFFAKPEKPEDTTKSAAAEVEKQADANAPVVPANLWLYKTHDPQTVTLGDHSGLSEFLLSIDIDATGSSIKSATMAEFFETVEDKQRYKKDPQTYPAACKENPEKYQGHYKVLRDVTYHDTTYSSLATRVINVFAATGKKLVELKEPASNPWKLVKKQTDPTTKAQSVTFEWPIYYNKSKDLKKIDATKYITLRKIYTVLPDSYSVDVRFEATSHTDKPISIEMVLSGPVGLDQQAVRTDLRMVITAKQIEDEIQPVTFGTKELLEWPYGEQHKLGSSTDLKEPMIWYGMMNKYFGSMVYFQPKNPQQLYDVATEVDYYATPVQESDYIKDKNPGRMWDTSMCIRNIEIDPKQTQGFDVNLFIGPKERDMFKADPLYNKLHYVDSIVTQGFAFCTFTWLMELLLAMLGFFAHTLFGGNYGLAIILLVLIVRSALHPLTKKGQVSMMSMQKRMAVLKPQMDKIREKYANDKTKMNMELMKLNKEHGNPMTDGMLGCLPMLLQMPIWVALYSSLSTSVALRHAAFLPFWITDLAAPDKLIVLKDSYWGIGHDINLLPILLTVAMFFQQKFMSPPAAATATPEQQQQQKMMKIMMPLMMLFIFYKLPSGLNLYIMASSTIGVIEQMYIRKHIKQQEELEAAQNAETVVEAGTRALRGKRAKKPKSPFKTN